MNNASHQRSILRRASLTLVALALMVPAVFMSVSAALAESTPGVNGRSVIAGHLVPALDHLAPQHASDTHRQLQLSISLNLRNTDQLDQLLREQNDRTSPLYHQYMTPQQFAAFFAPTADSVNQVANYLSGQGLHVGSISSNRTLIDVSGSTSEVEKAFHISLSDYAYKGRSVYAPTNEPSVPASLAGMIAGINGLNDVAQYRHAALKAQPHVGNGVGGGYTPGDLRNAYDMNSLVNSANGSGQTVALFELDSYQPSDINAYLNQYGLGSAKYSNVVVDGASTTPGSGAIEVELDMEVVSAIAPGATQKVYIGPNSTTGVNDTYNRIVTDDSAKVTSTSWGECESNSGNSELAALDNIFKQASAQGQAIFAAAGDAGAYDCGSTSLGVDSPASDPQVVGVGGTNLSVNSDGTYGSESVWSNSGDTSQFSKGVGGGGGYSSYFAKPSYQSGPGIVSTTARHVPDVSADADPNTGYSIYCTISAAQCPGWGVVGGTSAAAPLWASVATDTNEYLANQGKPGLGSASTTIYSLFNTTQTYSAYHDVTRGNNLYFNAATGYDVASGIGSSDAWNFARDAANGSSGTPTPSTTQLLSNAGFESGKIAPWTESSANGYTLLDNSKPHTGSYETWLCGYHSCTDWLVQKVALPGSTSKAVLSYWVATSTNYSGSACQDHLYVGLYTSAGKWISTVQGLCQSNKGYTQYTFDVTSALSSYHGQTIEVAFHGTTSSSDYSSFYLDDVALNVTH